MKHKNIDFIEQEQIIESVLEETKAKLVFPAESNNGGVVIKTLAFSPENGNNNTISVQFGDKFLGKNEENPQKSSNSEPFKAIFTQTRAFREQASDPIKFRPKEKIRIEKCDSQKGAIKDYFQFPDKHVLTPKKLKIGLKTSENVGRSVPFSSSLIFSRERFLAAESDAGFKSLLAGFSFVGVVSGSIVLAQYQTKLYTHKLISASFNVLF